jgi:hypothetical protein
VDPNPPAEIAQLPVRRMRVVIRSFPTFTDVMTAADPKGKQWSFLATEESYQAVREMQRNNLIVPVVGDFAGPKALRAVGQYLRGHAVTVSAFYVSNVEQYLTPPSKLRAFYENVALLPIQPSSVFIRSAQTSGVQPGPAQSSLSPMATTVDAVLAGQARNWSEIIQLSLPLPW